MKGFIARITYWVSYKWQARQLELAADKAYAVWDRSGLEADARAYHKAVEAHIQYVWKHGLGQDDGRP